MLPLHPESPEPAGVTPQAVPPSSPTYSFAFLLAVTLAGGLLAQAAYELLGTTGLGKRLPALVTLEIPPVLAGVVVPFAVIRLVYRKGLGAFGVQWREPGKPVWRWLLGASALALAGWTALWVVVFAAVGYVAGSPQAAAIKLTSADLLAKNPLARLVHAPPDVGALPYVLHMCVLVGFVEELFGRGLLVNALDRRYAKPVGVGRWTVRRSTLLASVLFAAWHVQWVPFRAGAIAGSAAVAMTVILVPSFVLCLVYEKTRSITATIALHNVIDGGKLVVWYVVGRLFLG